MRRWIVYQKYTVLGREYRRFTFRRAVKMADDLTRLTGNRWTVRRA